MPKWVQLLQALLTPAIALAVAAIAFFQWRTAERKRRQDLFDKRFEYFKRAQSWYKEVMLSDRSPGYGSHEIRDFAIEAEFLFGLDIGAHMREVAKGAGSGTNQYSFDWFAGPFKKYLILR